MSIKHIPFDANRLLREGRVYNDAVKARKATKRIRYRPPTEAEFLAELARMPQGPFPLLKQK